MGTGLVVLLDMDGLLVDSEPEWFAVEAAVFDRLGAGRAWTLTDAEELVGHALHVSAGRLVALAGSDRDPGVVADWFVDAMVDRMSAGVPWKPGARRLLVDLAAAGVRSAVVSSSHRRLVDTVLAQAPGGTVTASVAGDEVVRGKPSPDPYLQALRLLGAHPGQAVVLEDSPTGAAAGHAAGCRVVVVPDRVTLPDGHPWLEVASLTDLDVPVLASLVGADGTVR